MSVKIGHASISEHNTVNGTKGDQSGSEVCIRDWYSKPWKLLLRPKDASVAQKMVQACIQGCNNDNIGYGQNDRNSLRTEAAKVNWDLSKITTPCNTDCSAFMSVCAEAAGINIPYSGGNAPTTSSMNTEFLSTGAFSSITDNQYLTSDSYLKAGDILVTPGSHTVMVLGDSTDIGSLSTSASTNTSSTYTSTRNTTDILTPVAAVGMRTANMTPQPMMAFVNIYVGEKSEDGNVDKKNMKLVAHVDESEEGEKRYKPNSLRSFEIQKIADAGSKGSFTLFDDNWYKIEALFAALYDNIYIEYGYNDYTESPEITSKIYSVRLLQYSLSFTSTGTFLSVSFTSQGTVDNLKVIESLETNETNPVEAAKVICQRMGWSIGQFDSTSENYEEPFTLVGENPITYIEDVLAPAASSDSEDTVFLFQLSESNEATFKKFSYNAASRENIRTYVYMKGYDSVVLDATFDIKAVFGGTTDTNAASGLIIRTLDPDTNEEAEYSQDNVSVTTEATGTVQHMKSDQSVPLVSSAGYSPTYARNKLYYQVKYGVTSMYEATLTILGDPTIKLLDVVRLVNVTDDGYLHHTSGIYIVKGITDALSGGHLVTTLKLIRNGDIATGDVSSNSNTFELINPTTLVK